MKINMNTIILFLAVCLCGCSQRDMGNETGKVADHDSSLEKKYKQLLQTVCSSTLNRHDLVLGTHT